MTFGVGGVGLGFGSTGGGAGPTAAPPVAPSMAITSHSGGEVLDVANMVTISGTCTNGTTAMRVKYGGSTISTAANPAVITGTTWTMKWSPGAIRVGTANLTAEGEIGAGPTGTSSGVSVTVSGVPVRDKCNTFLHADDLAYADGAQVSTWTPRMGVTASGSAGATMETSSWDAKAKGFLKSVRLTAANSGRLDVDALASLLTAGNQPFYVVLIAQTIGATGARVFFSGGSSTSTTHKWLFWQTTNAPTSLKVLKGNSTTTTFDNNAKMRGDTGKHAYAALDSGSVVQVYRDWEARMGECTITGATGGGANTGGTTSSLINRATIGAYCSNGTYGNHWDCRIRAAWIGTSAPTQAQLDKILNFCVGNYDNDQYYADPSKTWVSADFTGQSNNNGIADADVADVPIPGSRMWNRSITNHDHDPTGLEDLQPISAQVGPWYFTPALLKTALGVTDLHVFSFGKGATGITTFIAEDDADYYSITLWDEFCRQFQAYLCAMGGSPTHRHFHTQGETDAQNGTAAGAYGTNLGTYEGKLRARIDPALKSVITKVNTNFLAGLNFTANVNSGIDTFVAGDAHATSINPSSMSGATYIQNDDLHYKRAGIIGLSTLQAAATPP